MCYFNFDCFKCLLNKRTHFWHAKRYTKHPKTKQHLSPKRWGSQQEATVVQSNEIESHYRPEFNIKWMKRKEEKVSKKYEIKSTWENYEKVWTYNESPIHFAMLICTCDSITSTLHMYYREGMPLPRCKVLTVKCIFHFHFVLQAFVGILFWKDASQHTILTALKEEHLNANKK